MSKIMNVGELKPTTVAFKWEISNFYTGCKKVGDYLCSLIFQSSYSSNIVNWQLQLYPKGKKEESKDYVGLFIKYFGEIEINYTVTLSILDCMNNKIKSNTMVNKSFLHRKWGFALFIHRKFITDGAISILNNDALNIFCEIIYDPEIPVLINEIDESNDKRYDSNNDEPNYRKELDDFEKLLETENLSDLTFVIGENRIHLHKAILASRSPVFHAMFEQEMKEKEEDIVVITDIKYEVLKEVLRFIYASKVNEIQKYSIDLLIAAEKYSISGLKDLCEKNLINHLSIQNALEYLTLSNTYNVMLLKEQVIDFIVSNQCIVNNLEFKLLDADLMCEVTRAIVEKNLQ